MSNNEYANRGYLKNESCAKFVILNIITFTKKSNDYRKGNF